MTTVRIPLIGSPTNRGTSVDYDQRFVNCFPEVIPNAVTEALKVYLLKRDGTAVYRQPSGTSGEGRGIASWNGNLYTVIGNKLYSSRTVTATWTSDGSTTVVIASTAHGYIDGNSVTIDFDGTVADGTYTVANKTANDFEITSGSSVAAGTGSCTITSNVAILTLSTSTGAVGFTEFSAANDYLVLVDGTKGYYISTTDVATEITDAQFPTPHLPYPVFMDGYIFLQKTTGQIYNCDVADIVNWQSTSYITPESYPDGGVAMCRQNNLLVSLGVYSVEFFYNAANPTPGSPLSRNSQAIIQFGCASGASVAQEEGLVMFVAQSATGEKFVVSVEGTKDTPISTEAINRILTGEGSNIVDCWGFLTRQKGHLMYVLNLPYQSRTVVYDVSTKLWHEWEWYDGASDSVFPMIDATDFQDKAYYLHQADGKIYYADPALYKDGSNDLKVLIQTSRFDGETAKLKFMDRLEVLGDWQSSSSPMTVYWSDDDYKTWTAGRNVDLQSRAYLYRCGSFRRRAFRLYSAANTPLRLIAVEAEVKVGTH